MILKVIISIKFLYLHWPWAIKFCKKHSGYRIGASKFFHYDENLSTSSRVNLNINFPTHLSIIYPDFLEVGHRSFRVQVSSKFSQIISINPDSHWPRWAPPCFYACQSSTDIRATHEFQACISLLQT